jgi:hypothetical protein
MLKAVVYIKSFNVLRSFVRYSTNSLSGLKLLLVPALNFPLINLFIRSRAIYN